MNTIHYYRVSTAQQGRSGLGLEAQRHAIEAFCSTRGCDMLAGYTEIESGKRATNRPELIKALHHAKVTGATLVIAKLDRLSRNAAFLMTLKDAGVRFVCADMPDANDMTIGVMALVAQQEREATSVRTKEALAAAKARGTWTKADGTPYKSGSRLGNPNGAQALRRASKGNTAAVSTIVARADLHARDLATVIEAIRKDGITSLNGIATQLNTRSIRTPRGGRWQATSVKNLLNRLP